MMDVLAKSMAVKQEDRGTVITLSGSVLFESGKATLLAGAQEKLSQVAQALKNQAEHHFIIEGHTDAVGSSRINDELSKKRAEAVKMYLVSQGVSPELIESRGMGSTKPIADNKSAEGRANNRRVEIVVQPDSTRQTASASSPSTKDE